MKTFTKKTLALVVMVACCITLLPLRYADAAEKTKVAYLALGDSLTDYATYDGKDWTTYPVYVKEKLEKSKNVEIVIHNDAKGGYTTDDVLYQITNDAKVIDDIKKADFITICIGGNDIIHMLGEALYRAGYDTPDLIGSKNRITTSSPVYKAVTDALGNSKNELHAKYIASTKQKANEIISTIKSFNPNCKIALTNVGYNDLYGVSTMAKVVNMDLLTSYSFTRSVKTAINEIQQYYKAIASANANVYYVDLDSLFNYRYFQFDDKGNFVDFHPNYDGQVKMADCFINDFWKKVDFSKAKGAYTTETSVENPYYKFTAINDSTHSFANAVIGDENILTLDAKGIGSKLYCSSDTDSRSFELKMKPAKAAGVITGLSFWDTSNASEVLIRFEGTNTTKLVVCSGGNGKYVSKSLSLGFDASLAEHKYNVAFDNNKVNIIVDDKNIGSLDITSVTSPVSQVTPIIFIEKADWTGKFAGTPVSSVFSEFVK